MKILVMPVSYPTAANPVTGVFFHEQAEALAAVHDVAVFVQRQAGWWSPGKLLKTPRFSRGDYDGVRVYRGCGIKLAPAGMLPGVVFGAYLQSARANIARVIADWGRPDIIHAHVSLPAGWAVVRLGEELGIPVVITEHSSAFAEWMKQGTTRRMVEEAMCGASQIIAVSPSLAERINGLLPGVNVKVIGNVVQTDRFTPSEVARRSPTYRFLCVATLKKVKGVEFLVKAAKKLLDRGMDHFEVLIGGDGPERVKLQNLAAQLELGGHVRFLDLLDKNDVVEQVRACDALVAPSLLETFCVIAAEAMACGKPVVSTKCGGPEWVVPEHAGVLVEPGNATALADAMGEFMSGNRVFDAAAIRQSVVDRFSPEVIVGELGGVYEGL